MDSQKNYINTPNGSITSSNESFSPDFAAYPHKKTYTAVHTVFALLALVLGGLYMQMNSNISPTVFTAAFYIFAAAFYIFRGKRHFTAEQIFFAAMTVIYSLRFVFFKESSALSILTLTVMHITALLSLLSAEGNVWQSIIPETVKAVFFYPFKYFLALPKSIFCSIGRKNSNPDEKAKRAVNAAYVFVGICAGAPILLTLSFLLCSDRIFDDFAGKTFDFIWKFFAELNIFEYFNVFTVLVAMYIFGAICASEEPVKRKYDRKDFFPPQIVNTVMIMTIVLYVFFFVAQISSYAGMIFGKLPEGMTYAEFARSGFFQLCAAACINGAIIYLSYVLSDPTEENGKLRKSAVILASATLLLVLTAAVKMGMYVSAYGFTEKRFYAMWFMLLLFIIFTLSFVKIKKPQFKLSQYGTVITAVFLAALFLINFPYVSDKLNFLLGFKG